jgi:Family of unknown function (DUF5808)
MKFEIQLAGLEIEIKGLAGVLTLTAIGLVVAAIAKELARPSDERTWHGRVAGVVPYDLRPPTWERLRASLWNPDDSRVVTDKSFGVGWDVNVGALARKTGLLP